MMMTPEKISKLPKWAQEEIKEMQRKTDLAIGQLKEFLDEQTPSPFYVENYNPIAKGISAVRKYITGDRLWIEHGGVKLSVILRSEKSIDLSWSNEQDRDVAFMPVSYQQAKLITKENMR